MKKLFLTSILAGSACIANLPAQEKSNDVGFVNFTTCRTDSKIGKHEQQAMEKVLENMRELIADREKGLKEMQAKFQDSDYMDGLNPAAAEEMKGQFQAMQEEYGRYQQQYMQVMQQANMKLMQAVHEHSKNAAERIAREKNLNYIIPAESVLYCASNLDLTDQVIAEMDREFDKQNPQGSVK